MKIKSLTVKLAALLCACGLAFSAWADNVAKIGEVEYATLQGAVDAAQDGATKTTITLLADIALDNTVEIEWPKPASGSGLFIDLNNHNITATDCRALWIKTGYVTLTGHGTISSVATENSSFSKDSSVIRVGSTESQAQAAATLDVKAEVTVSTTHCYGITVFGNNKGTNGQTLTCSGTVTTKDRPAIAGNGTSTLSSTSITINDGATVSATSEYAIYHPQAGALSIKGTVTGLGGIEMKAGTLTIESTGIITATGTASHPGVNNNGASTSGYALVLVENSGYKGGATAKISKGAINGTIGIIADDDVDSSKKATLAVSGGSFSLAVPAAYCADGYEPTSADSNDRYTVQVAAASAVAKITRDNVITYYLKVLDAVNAAQDGETVTMIKDFSQSYPGGGLINVAAGKSVTLDLNNHSIINLSATGGSVASLANGYSTLTLKGPGLIQGKNAIKVTGAGTKVIIDGNITVTGTEACFYISGSKTANPVVEIKNGTFHGGSKGVFDKGSLKDNITIAISGGLFDDEVLAEYCAEGYTCVANTDSVTAEDYPYAVVETLKVAQIVRSETVVGRYETLAAAIDAAQDGDTVTLLADVTTNAVVMIGKSLTLNGNGHSLITSASRAIRVDSGNVDVTVKNLTIPANAKVERAIQVDSDKDNVKLTVDNVTATATMYTVNICGYVDNLNLTVTNSVINGWGAVNLWGNSGTVRIEDSTLNSVNDKGYNAEGWNDFGAIIVEGDTTGLTDEHASAYNITVVDTTITASSTTGNHQYVVLYNDPSVSNAITLEGCSITLGENGLFFLDQGYECVTKVKGTYLNGTTERPALPAGYLYVPCGNDYYLIAKAVAQVVRDEAVIGQYATLAEAIDAAQTGDTVELLDNVTTSDIVLIGKSITLDGKGRSLITSANRAIRVNNGNVDVMVKNLTIPANAKVERAIQVDIDKDNVTLTIDNVRATATMYTVNVCNDVDNLNLTVTNSVINGWGVVNLWGNSGTVRVADSTLNSVNDKGYNAEGWNDFGAIIAEGDTTGLTDEHASAYNITVVDTTIAASSTTGNHQYVVLYNDPSVSNAITLEGCSITLGENGLFFLDQGYECVTKVKETYLTSTTERPALPDGYLYAPCGNDYYLIAAAATQVVRDEAVIGQYATLAEAIDAAQTGDTVELLADVTTSDIVFIDKSITLDGKGRSLITSASRAIRVDSGNVDVTVKNLTIPANAKVERAIQVDSDKDNVTLTIDNVMATATMYTVNVCGYVDNLNLTVTNSVINGWGAVNLWGNSGTVRVVDSTLNSVNDKGYNAAGWNDFGAIIVEGDTTGLTDEHASAYNITVVDTTIAASSTTGNHQYVVLYNQPSVSNAITLEGCSITLGENGVFFLDQGDECVTKVKETYLTSTTERPALPDGYLYAPCGNDYYLIAAAATQVVRDEAVIGQYLTLSEAITAAQDGDTVTLLADVTTNAVLMIGKSLTLDGNGHSLITSASRAIRVDSGNVDVTVKNLTIPANAKVERAIQVDIDKDNVTLTIDNVRATATMYTVNVCNDVDNLNLTVTNSVINGWGVVNLWGNSGTVRIEDSTLNSVNDKGYNAEGWNDFGAIIAEGDTTGLTDEHASAYNITVVDTTIAASSTTGNHQYVVLYNDPSVSNAITFEGCSITLGENGLFFLDQGYECVTKVKGTYLTGTTERPALPAGYLYVPCGNDYYLIAKAVAQVGTELYATFAEAIAAADAAGVSEITILDGTTDSPDADWNVVDGKLVKKEYVAQIEGGAKFESLDAAVAAAQAGDTIKLLADIAYGTDREVPVWGKPVNIDLDGHTLTTLSEVSTTLGNQGYKAAALCFSIADPCNITIGNGTIVTAYGAGVYADDPGITLTLTNLTINAATKGTQSTAEYSAAVRVTYESKVIIESGTYSGAYSVAASNSGADITINGGTFKDDLFFSASTTSGKTKTITITGGEFLGGDFVNTNKGTLTISGGDFAKYIADATGYIVEGKTCTTKMMSNGLYRVVDAATVTFAAGTDAPSGATVPAAITYPSGDAAEIALANATCTDADYTFGGWRMTVGDNKVVAALPAGTMGDQTLIATWVKATKIEVATDSTKPEETVEVKVTDEWVDANVTKAGETATAQEIKTALEATKANGLTGLENYVLGLDGTAKVKVDSEIGASETAVPVVNTLKPTEQTVDTGFKVQYSLDKVSEAGATITEGTKQDTSDLSLDLTKVADTQDGVGYYKMTATITKEGVEGTVSKVSSENTIGVLAVKDAPATTIIGVPWKSLTEGNIKVDELVRTENLTEGDEIKVYDTTAGKYKAWTLNENKEWEEVATVSQETTEEPGAATGTTVARGAGVWLTRHNPSEPIYLMGQATVDAVEKTPVEVPAEAGKEAWTLVASPKVEPVKVADVAAGEGDIIRLPTTGAPKDFKYRNGKWGYTEYYVDDNGLTRSRRVETDDKTTIPAGRGFWYINKSTDADKKIDWDKQTNQNN